MSYGAINLYMRGVLEEETKGNLSKVTPSHQLYALLPLNELQHRCLATQNMAQHLHQWKSIKRKLYS